MFEDKHNIEENDILMRSILSQAQEEVPERAWEGISKELDRIDKVNTRRPVVLWLRRTSIAVAAAAAVAVGVFMNRGDNGDYVPEAVNRGMIAVVEQPSEEAGGEKEPEAVYLADAAREVAKARQTIETEPVSETAEGTVEEAVEVLVKEPVKETLQTENGLRRTADAPQINENQEDEQHYPAEWPEDEAEERLRKHKVRTSLVVSGLAGTNNSRNSSEASIGRQPASPSAPPKTGIKETSTESTYGIPLSAGVGVKIDFSPKWSLGVGVNYTLLTRRFYGNYTLVNEAGTIEKSTSSDIRNSQQYIGIPVNLFYNIMDSDHMNFYAYAGGTVEKCISDRYDLLSTDIIYTEKTKGVQLSANVGIGVEFMLGQHLGLYIDPSLRYYFNNGQPKSIRTAQPLMLGFEMGLRVRL